MIVVISQPMLFPWVGMLEQLRLADTFVDYSDVQFSKGSFVNRVQIKTEAGCKWMTVPLQDFHLGQQIDEVRCSRQVPWRHAHHSMLADAYQGARYRDDMLDLVDSVYRQGFEDIGSLSYASTCVLGQYFGLSSDIAFRRSSELETAGSGSQRVLGIVRELGGTTYVTGHGAVAYLDHELFESAGVRVEYMDYAKIPYPQLHGDFTPFVSALDLVANMGPDGANLIRSDAIYWKEFLNAR